MQHQNFEIKHLSIFQRAIYDKAREAYLFYHLYVSSFVYLLVKRHNCLQRFEMQKLCTQQISCYIVNVGNGIETKTIPSRHRQIVLQETKRIVASIVSFQKSSGFRLLSTLYVYYLCHHENLKTSFFRP